ncbi:MAG: hypothetical protein HY078_04330 [Elusimicrobia bacterium]|nr:hypothetical protein [Elusimicrobiota bacterium]
MTILTSAALLPGLANAEIVDCPKGSELAQTDDERRPWVCVTTSKSRDTGLSTEKCPKETTKVITTNTYGPFRCALDGIDPSPPGTMRFTTNRAPGRSGPVAEPGSGNIPHRGPPRPPKKRAPPKPPPKGDFPPIERGRRIEKRAPDPGALPPGEKDYFTFHAPGRVRFDLPKKWQIVDRWTASPPTVSALVDLPRDGRQIIVRVTFCRKDPKDCQEYDTAVYTESKATPPRRESRASFDGAAARVFAVPGESRIAYVKVPDGYFMLSYAATAELYTRYSPVFERLLRSFKTK